MTKLSLKVAVASKDGISINQHFGHATLFWIYEVSEDGLLHVENRDVDNYCHGHTGSQSAMEKILVTIQDCYAVFSAKIGDGPVKKLENISVKSVSSYAYEAVGESLLDYYQTWCSNVSEAV